MSKMKRDDALMTLLELIGNKSGLLLVYIKLLNVGVENLLLPIDLLKQC